MMMRLFKKIFGRRPVVSVVYTADGAYKFRSFDQAVAFMLKR